MRTLNNVPIMFKDKPLLDEATQEAVTVKFIIKFVLENSAYQNSSEIIKASRILATVDNSSDVITLDDADYAFVKQWSSVYPPIVNKGLMFLDYFKQLE